MLLFVALHEGFNDATPVGRGSAERRDPFNHENLPSPTFQNIELSGSGHYLGYANGFYQSMKFATSSTNIKLHNKRRVPLQM